MAIVMILIGFLLTTYLSIALVHRAVRLSEGQPSSLSEAIGAGGRFILPAFAGTLIVLLLFMLGSLAFIVPGLWVMGLYAVYLPVIVVEGRRRGVLTRTRELTRGYRWPLAGFPTVVYGVTFIISALIELLSFVIGFGAIAQIIGMVLSAVGTGLIFAAITVAMTLAYQRLVEIKEGGMRPGLTAVFE